MFRHGLRVSEACGMKLDQVDTESRVLHVARLKGGLSTMQPLCSDELRAISAWLKERDRMKSELEKAQFEIARLRRKGKSRKAKPRGSTRKTAKKHKK